MNNLLPPTRDKRAVSPPALPNHTSGIAPFSCPKAAYSEPWIAINADHFDDDLRRNRRAALRACQLCLHEISCLLRL